MTQIASNDFAAKLAAYADAAKLNIVTRKDKVSDANAKHFDRSIAMLANETIAQALIAADVDASRYTSQVYAFKKENAILDYLFNNKTMQNYIAEIFVSAFRKHHVKNAALTKSEAKLALNKSAKLSESEATYIVQQSKIIDESTVNAQHKTTLDAFVNLRMFSQVSTFETRDAYAINLESDMTQRMIARLNIADMFAA
ncbi:hypothetical protein [Aureimonas sp. AU40]|uniref:hypothetical protein n=1 Tax=Aureimonas sp. AU40 TaxID=1637747 RepID=UPI0007859563|nr:hypothetical protein [Aureimonas sp. AU40]